MKREVRIIRIDPPGAIAGGEVAIECENYDTGDLRQCRAMFGDVRGWMVAASPRRVLAVVPDVEEGGEVAVRLESGDSFKSAPASLVLGKKLAEDLHPVANPAFDPDDGSLYVTRSGSRGQRVPVSLFRIDAGGELVSLHGEITNPTGIAFDRTGQMYVTSRMDGTVYRVTQFDEVVPFARNLGVATGIAFDRAGRMYVGDRRGTIFRVNEIGQPEEWAHLEASVAAYHLAFGPDDALYVTGATVASSEAVIRLDEDGVPDIFYRGLGRPHGLAFDREGNLYVAASFRGRRGIVRISPDASDARLFVAGVNFVGLAFSAEGDMAVATNDSIYRLPLGIRGTLV
jgi:sugar lactone lactonase YvrE